MGVGRRELGYCIAPFEGVQLSSRCAAIGKENINSTEKREGGMRPTFDELNKLNL